MRTPTHIDLFAGIGGFLLAAESAGFRTIVFCEKNEFCKKVLRKNWPHIPIESDIEHFNGRKYHGTDLLTGGFPCQPFSQAGKRKGKADDCYLWPDMFRIIQESNPAWVLGENVDGLDGLGLDDSISDLESIGYEVAPPLEIPACAQDAKHPRNRIWIIANFNPQRRLGGGQRDGSSSQPEQCSTRERKPGSTATAGCGQVAADSDGEGKSQLQRSISNERGWTCNSTDETDANTQEQFRQKRSLLEASGGGQSQIESGGFPCDGRIIQWSPTSEWFECEPDVGRMVHGIPDKTHRIAALGNAIVPQVAFQILKEIYREIIRADPK